MDLQTKIAMVLSVASLSLLLFSLIKRTKVMKFDFTQEAMITLTIPLKGLLKLTGIAFNGTHFSHVKTNSSNDVQVVLTELLHWEKPENKPEGLSVSDGRQDGHFIGRPMNRFEMSDNRIEEKIEVYRTENVPVSNSLTPLGIRNFLIDKMFIAAEPQVETSMHNCLNSGRIEGPFRGFLHNLMEAYHLEMQAQGKAEQKSPNQTGGY